MKKLTVLFIILITLTLTCLANTPKYIFMFIGDGMGAEQVNATQLYLNANENSEKNSLNLLKFPVKGMTMTHTANFFITDSAAAGTALATGYKTNLGILGLDPSLNITLESVAERARDTGKKVGIITTVSADQATPAAFFAHQPSRSNYYEISRQLVESNFNFFGGGSVIYPEGKEGHKENIFKYAKDNGYIIIDTQSEYESFAAEDSKHEKVWIINEDIVGDSAIPYSIDNRGTFDLPDITKTAIDFLDNTMGFFLMVEGGKIDWACHSNDAAGTIYDIIALDNAIKHALNFYNEHPEDTLIVVTGDHETGGMKIEFPGIKNAAAVELLSHQTVSEEYFERIIEEKYDDGQLEDFERDVLPEVKKYFGLSVQNISEQDKRLLLNEEEVNKLKKSFDDFREIKETSEQIFSVYGENNPIAITCVHILNSKAGISWSTYTHTGALVVTYALGNGQELFSGYYDNTDIAKGLFSLLGKK